tara:strand:- start:11735 stop:12436 length:702 start_codon:yes stop_codon:yes gene_type:complete
MSKFKKKNKKWQRKKLKKSRLVSNEILQNNRGIMHLYRKDIGIVFINEQVSGVYPYKYSDEDLDGWVNISIEDGIVNNDLYGGYAADYVRATKEIALLFEAKRGDTELEKWGECTDAERVCLAKRMVVNSITLRLQVFNSTEDSANFTQHAENSIDCRQTRTDTAKIQMGYQLTIADRVDLFNSIQLLIVSYVNTNDASIITWMHSDDGFRAKRYYTTQLENTFTKTVENGIY